MAKRKQKAKAKSKAKPTPKTRAAIPGFDPAAELEKVKQEKRCMRCDSAGSICTECGESDPACQCGCADRDDCPDCAGDD